MKNSSRLWVLSKLSNLELKLVILSLRLNWQLFFIQYCLSAFFICFPTTTFKCKKNMRSFYRFISFSFSINCSNRVWISPLKFWSFMWVFIKASESSFLSSGRTGPDLWEMTGKEYIYLSISVLSDKKTTKLPKWTKYNF
jgi:hypothetical protein